MAAKKFAVTGDQYRTVHRRMRDILRQLDQEDGSPLDPAAVSVALQRIVENKLGVVPATQKFLSDPSVVTLSEHHGRFNPDKSLVTGEGLYVSDSFRNRVVAAARRIDDVPACEIAFCDLVRNANDQEIQSELPEGYLFKGPSQFCVLLFGIIDRQAGGKNGPLLTNGHWNVFYVLVNGEVFVVHVYLSVESRWWFVHASPLNGRRWLAGARAFSRKY